MKLLKIIIGIILISKALFSLDIPINKVINIDIKLGDFSVVEFPFEIKGTNKATFIPHTKNVKDGEKTSVKKLISSNSSADSLTIKRGKNTFTFFPKKFGKLSLVVWGYKEHPVMLNLNVTSNDVSQYYRFVDYSQDLEDAGNFEATSHELTITRLMKYLFNNKAPSGYKNITEGRQYKLGALNFSLVTSLMGKKYRGDEWVVKNLGSDNISLYEEMFYADGIYAISFEASRLKPLEKCRMFIVRKNVE